MRVMRGAEELSSLVACRANRVNVTRCAAAERGPSGTDGPTVAIVEQKLPFALLDFETQRDQRRVVGRALAQIDEIKWIPIRRVGQVGGRWEVCVAGQLARSGGQRTEDGMLTDAAKPVLRVAKIPLAAMHDAVPKAAVGVVDRLTDLVRLVEEVVAQ